MTVSIINLQITLLYWLNFTDASLLQRGFSDPVVKELQVDEGLYLQDGGRTWIRTMDLILIRDAL